MDTYIYFRGATPDDFMSHDRHIFERCEHLDEFVRQATAKEKAEFGTSHVIVRAISGGVRMRQGFTPTRESDFSESFQ